MTTNLAKETIYQFKVTDLSGDTFDFATLKEKKIFKTEDRMLVFY